MSDTQNIIALLTSNDPESIREGAHLAGEHGLADAIPSLVQHISSANIGVQEAVDRALLKIGGAAVVHAVIPLLRSDDAPVRNIAMELLRHLGKTDIEALSKLLQDNDADVRIFISDILGSVSSPIAVPPLCHALLQDPEVNVRYQAAVSLGALNFSEAAPCLNKALNDEEWVQFAVIEALTKLRDESSIRAMLQALEKATDLVASTIVDALGEMGNIKAVPLLLKRLDASPIPLCNKIVHAVINIMGERSLSLLGAQDCDRLRSFLKSAIEDEDHEVQDAAVKAYAAFGGDEATLKIIHLASQLDLDRDQDRILFMINALTQVGRTPALVAAIEDESDLIVQIAVEVLLRTDSEDAVDLLIDKFWNCSRDVQRNIILELATRAGKNHQQFFLDVLERHTDGTVLRGALLYLGQKGDAAAVHEKVIALLSHPFDDVKESALEACIMLRTPAIEQFFKGLTKHHDPVQRMMGVYALGFFGIAGNIEELKDALQDEADDVRKVAIEAFGRECPISDGYIQLIERSLTDPSREVRMAVFDTLGFCSDERLVACLIAGLDDSDPWVRVRCAERLGENRAAQATSRLIEMLEDNNNLIVIKSIEALGKIGGETAFRALLPMLEHEDQDFREAAEIAVDTIHRQAGE